MLPTGHQSHAIDFMSLRNRFMLLPEDVCADELKYPHTVWLVSKGCFRFRNYFQHQTLDGTIY